MSELGPWGAARTFPDDPSLLGAELSDGYSQIRMSAGQDHTIGELTTWALGFYDHEDFVSGYFVTSLAARSLLGLSSTAHLLDAVSSGYFVDGIGVHAASLGEIMGLIGSRQASGYVLQLLVDESGFVFFTTASKLEIAIDARLLNRSDESAAIDQFIAFTGLVLLLFNETGFILTGVEDILRRFLLRARKHDPSLSILSTPIFQRLIDMGMKIDLSEEPTSDAARASDRRDRANSQPGDAASTQPEANGTVQPLTQRIIDHLAASPRQTFENMSEALRVDPKDVSTAIMELTDRGDVQRERGGLYSLSVRREPAGGTAASDPMGPMAATGSARLPMRDGSGGPITHDDDVLFGEAFFPSPRDFFRYRGFELPIFIEREHLTNAVDYAAHLVNGHQYETTQPNITAALRYIIRTLDIDLTQKFPVRAEQVRAWIAGGDPSFQPLREIFEDEPYGYDIIDYELVKWFTLFASPLSKIPLILDGVLDASTEHGLLDPS